MWGAFFNKIYALPIILHNVLTQLSLHTKTEKSTQCAHGGVLAELPYVTQC